MNLRPIINEMRAFWLEGQTGGQLLIGGSEAHYDIDKTPTEIVVSVWDVVCRKRFNDIALWEIEAVEKENVDVKERLANGV